MLIDEFVGEEDVYRLCQLLFFRLFQHIKRDDVFNTQSFQLQDEIAQIYPQYLRRKPIWHSVESCLLKRSEALSIRDSSSPSCPLIGAALPARHDDHLIDACFPVEHLHLHISAINHVLHFWDGDRTFCDVCRKDYLPVITPLKDKVLILRAHLGVKRKHLQPSLVFHHIGIQHMRHSLDLLHRSQENQNLASWLFSVYVNDGLKHLEEIVLGGFFEVVNGNLMQSTCDINRFYA